LRVPAKLVRARDLREALSFAFVHRTSVRWRAGTSAMLDLAYDGTADAPMIVDVRHVPDFHTVRADRSVTSIGAFAHPETIARDPALPPALGTMPLGPHEARFRLSALGASIVVAGPGATRSTDLATVLASALPPHEIPVAVTLRRDAPAVWFGDRRIKRRDGAASFELRVHVALALTGAHRIERATVAHGIDGGPPVPLPEVAAELSGSMIAKTTFAQAARRAADAFRGDDERTNVLRRTIIPLVLSALHDAYAASRAARP
jgi:CO/xanthine dehydrogenase FAD-binding subunit